MFKRSVEIFFQSTRSTALGLMEMKLGNDALSPVRIFSREFKNRKTNPFDNLICTFRHKVFLRTCFPSTKDMFVPKPVLNDSKYPNKKQNKNLANGFLCYFSTNNQKPSNRIDKDAIIKKIGSRVDVSRLTLTEIKDIVKNIPKRWLNDENIRSLFLSFYNERYKEFFQKTPDIYELEKFTFLFYWGQIFLDTQRKEEIFGRYVDLLNQHIEIGEIDSRTLYTFCKTLNYIVSFSYFSPSELKKVLESVSKALSFQKKFDEFYMRGIILLLNAILIQADFSPFSNYIREYLAKLQQLDLLNSKVANMALYSLENLKILVDETEEVYSELTSCLDKIPFRDYIRKDIEDSNTQKKIASILIDMTYFVEQNELVGIYSVDFLLRPKLIIEYHGVSHYHLNNQDMIQAHQVKVRALRKMGYYVQVIPYYKWSILESKHKQETYLRELIYEPFYKLGSRS